MGQGTDERRRGRGGGPLFMGTRLRCLALLISLLLSGASVCAQTPEDAYSREFRRGFEALSARRFEAGIASMKRCLELRPDASLPAYNLACAYSLQRELDTAFVWLERSIDAGLQFERLHGRKLLLDDPDLGALRGDPRFAAVLERCTAQSAAVDAFVGAPVVYVPSALESAEALPLLVVLHDSGDTKDAAFAKGPWKQIADELGYALLIPSAPIPLRFRPRLDPTRGMTWFTSVAEYEDNFTHFERPVVDAVNAFRKQRKLDPERVHIVGVGAAAMLALNLGVSYPGRYRGVVTYDGAPSVRMLGGRTSNAAKLGLEVKLLFPDQPRGAGTSPSAAEYAALLDGITRALSATPLRAEVVRYASSLPASGVAAEPIKDALRSFARRSAPPDPVAGEPKKD